MAMIPSANFWLNRRWRNFAVTFAIIAALYLVSGACARGQSPATSKKQWFRLPVALTAPAGDPSRTAECAVEYGPTRPITGLAFSPDGKTLAVGGHQEVLLWNLELGTLLRRLGAGALSNTARSVVFSGDGRSIAAADGLPARFGAARLLDVASGYVTASLTGPTDEILSLALSPDGRLLAGGSVDTTVHVWDLQTKEVVTNLTGHTGWVTGVAFSPDGRHLATAGSDRKTHIWAVESWKLVSRAMLPEPAFSAVFSPDGSFLAFGCGGPTERSLRLRRMEDLFKPPTNAPPPGKRQGSPPLRAVKTELAIPSALAWSITPIGPKSPATTNASPGRLYAACSDKSVKVFSPGGKLVTNLWGHSDWVTSVAISPDGRKLATGSADGTVKLWNPIQFRLVATLIHVAPGSDAWAFITPLGFFNASSPGVMAWTPPGPKTTPEDLNRRFLNPEAVRIALNALRPPPGAQPASRAGDAPGGSSGKKKAADK